MKNYILLIPKITVGTNVIRKLENVTGLCQQRVNEKKNIYIYHNFRSVINNILNFCILDILPNPQSIYQF